jgi:F-type H+-transporting ATPase subunit b
MDIGQILANLGFDWRIALANLVNFLVIVFILTKFAFKPIEKTVKEREDKIKKGIEDAERSTTELQMSKQTSEKLVLEAGKEANRIIASAQKESEKIIAEGKLLQEDQAKQILAKANKVIQQERQSMMQDLKKEVVDLVIMATGKFVKEDMTKEKQEEIVKRLIKE